MKLWVTTRPLPNHTAHHRLIPGNTLHRRHNNGLCLNRPHLPRRTTWLTNPQHSRQRRLNILHLPIPTHRTGPVLRLIPVQRNLKHWYHSIIHHHSHCIHRLCPAMRTNIILRGYSNHKPPFSYPLRRHHHSTVNLRRILSGQRHPNPVLYLPLPIAILNFRTNSTPPYVPTRNRL